MFNEGLASLFTNGLFRPNATTPRTACAPPAAPTFPASRAESDFRPLLSARIKQPDRVCVFQSAPACVCPDSQCAPLSSPIIDRQQGVFISRHAPSSSFWQVLLGNPVFFFLSLWHGITASVSGASSCSDTLG